MLGFIDRFTGWAGELIEGFVGGAAGAAAEGAINLMMSFWYGLIADAVAAVTGHLVDALDATTGVSLESGWWTSPEAQATWRHVLGISAGLLLLFYLLQIVKGVATGDTGALVRTAAVTLPTTVAATIALVAVTSALLTATDDATALVTGDLGTNLGEFSALLGSAQTLSGAGFLGLLFALLYVLGAVFIWIQMVIRAALIYVLVMFAPLAIAARVFDGSRHIARRVVEIGIALILSKFAIGLTLATGAAAVAGGNGPTPDGDVVIEPSALIAGPSIMLLGAFMPFVLYKLIPVFEGAAIGQGVASGPLRAISTAGGVAFAAHSLGRLAGTGRTATPGTAPASSPSPATPAAAPSTAPAPSTRLAATTVAASTAPAPPASRHAPGGPHTPPPT